VCCGERPSSDSVCSFSSRAATGLSPGCFAVGKLIVMMIHPESVIPFACMQHHLFYWNILRILGLGTEYIFLWNAGTSSLSSSLYLHALIGEDCSISVEPSPPFLSDICHTKDQGVHCQWSDRVRCVDVRHCMGLGGCCSSCSLQSLVN